MFPYYFKTKHFKYRLDSLNPFKLYVRGFNRWHLHVFNSEEQFSKYFFSEYVRFKKVALKEKLDLS